MSFVHLNVPGSSMTSRVYVVLVRCARPTDSVRFELAMEQQSRNEWNERYMEEAEKLREVVLEMLS